MIEQLEKMVERIMKLEDALQTVVEYTSDEYAKEVARKALED